MMKKNNGMTAKILLGLPLLLLLILQSCSLSAGVNPTEHAGATWTPVAHPTDRPYQVKTETVSYFGSTPFLVILGSRGPDDNAPLQVLNISTEDIYDVSEIPPAPASTWSRPIASENKDVYFQVEDTLYILSPGGQTRSVELPYDEQNPAFCNWSWKGQLVCLSDGMTAGFLVDQELNVVEMNLDSDAGGNGETYYNPYRVGENGLRVVQVIPEIMDGEATVFYRDLDLEALAVQSKEIRIETDLYETFYGYPSSNELETQDITRKEGEIVVIGVSDSGDKVYFASRVTYKPHYRNGRAKTRWWTDVYDGSTLETINFDFEITNSIGKTLKGDYLLTDWLIDPEDEIVEQPTVYDLDAGKIVFTATGSILIDEIVNFIQPYGENWVAGDTSGVHFYRYNGNLLMTYPFPEAFIDSMDADSYYTISQPMEP